MDGIYALVAGTLYGLLIGIIPSAGATTGLVALFGFISYFVDQPYLGVIFCMAVVAASTTGDTYTGVLLGIPGANSAAATMVDGFPLAQKGQATYAITAAVTTSTVNGLLWGALTFALLPWYTNLLMILGIPELWAFTMLALATVGFVTSTWWVRSLIAIAVGIGLGFIGTDPATNAERYTMGWDYLGNGIQLMPFLAGLFAVPELVDGLKRRLATTDSVDQFGQTVAGVQAVWANKFDALRGGFIGAFIGLLIFRAPFDFFGILGLLSLAGIIINNGIVLIDRIDAEQKGGRDAYSAIIEATVSRFRPIWMTTITTILGVMPLILSHDPVFYSLALIIAAGLAFATVLTLGVVPVLYAVLFKVQPAKAGTA